MHSIGFANCNELANNLAWDIPQGIYEIVIYLFYLSLDTVDYCIFWVF
jgi:hypothetical protein